MKPLGPQQRDEVVVCEQPAERLDHEDQPVAGRLGPSDEKALLVDVGAVDAH